MQTQQMDVSTVVLDYFCTRHAIPGSTAEDKLACEYLDGGIVDSMGIISLVIELEGMFDVQFTPEDMQSEDFRTIGGLVRVIERRRENG